MVRRDLVLALLSAAGTLQGAQRLGEEEKEPRLPNGKSQRMAILKQNHEKSLADVAEILSLASALQKELEENTQYVLSLESVRKAEKIEELAHDVAERMKRA